MRILCVVLGAVLGLFVGFVWALDQGWGAKSVMMLFCALVGTVLGATVALILGGGSVGTGAPNLELDDKEAVTGFGFAAKSSMKRFMAEEGKPTSCPGFAEPENEDHDVSRPFDH